MKTSLFLLTTSVFLGGCQLWYKSGADADDLNRDQATCRATAAKNLEQCMREKGWSHGQASTATEPPHELQPTRTAPKVAPEPSPVAHPQLPPRLPRGTNTSKPITHELPTPRPTPGSPARPAAMQVGSWFKVGAGPGQLQADQQACGRPADAEGSLSWRIDQGFRQCMKQRGWYALP